MSQYAPGGGDAPPHLQDDRAPSDLDPAVVDAILVLVNSHLDENRHFNNPAVLDEIPKLLRNFDPADDIFDQVEKLCLEANKPGEQEHARTNGPSSSTETEGPTIVQGTRLDHAPSDLDPATLDQIRRLDPESETETESESPIIVPGGRLDHAPNPGPTECKYYLRPGGCKHGKACRYIHSREKTTVAPVVDTNFAGLPIRPGEKECAYFMRHGECKYASNCRFSHPDPVAEGGSDPSSGYDEGGPALQGASEATWSPEGPSQTTESNGYQSPAGSMPARPPYVMNSSMAESSIYKQYPYLNQVEEFPERPGQPVCSYFLRTGDCKFRSSCKYHHPKIVLP